MRLLRGVGSPLVSPLISGWRWNRGLSSSRSSLSEAATPATVAPVAPAPTSQTSSSQSETNPSPKQPITKGEFWRLLNLAKPQAKPLAGSRKSCRTF